MIGTNVLNYNYNYIVLGGLPRSKYVGTLGDIILNLNDGGFDLRPYSSECNDAPNNKNDGYLFTFNVNSWMTSIKHTSGFQIATTDANIYYRYYNSMFGGWGSWMSLI